MYSIYIIECMDGSLYTGITTDIDRRFVEHQNGKGARYTRTRGVVRVVYTEEYSDRSSASKREILIKRLSRKEKLTLIQEGR